MIWSSSPRIPQRNSLSNGSSSSIEAVVDYQNLGQIGSLKLAASIGWWLYPRTIFKASQELAYEHAAEKAVKLLATRADLVSIRYNLQPV